MRALTSTAISFGLHTIPVRLATMIRDNGTSLSNSCPHCKGDVGNKNYCKGCLKEVTSAEIQKAYRISKDQKVVFTKEQVENLKNFDKAVTIEGTIPKTSIDQRMIEGCYYVLPDKKIQKAWGILFSAINTGDQALVVKFSIRSRQKLGVLTTDGKVIVLLAVAFAEQFVRMDEELNIAVSEKETEMGLGFIKGLPSVDINTISDEYKTRLEELVAGKPMVEVKTEESASETSFFTQPITA